MKYETPELIALEAINAVESTGTKSLQNAHRDFSGSNESTAAYADWE